MATNGADAASAVPCWWEICVLGTKKINRFKVCLHCAAADVILEWKKIKPLFIERERNRYGALEAVALFRGSETRDSSLYVFFEMRNQRNVNRETFASIERGLLLQCDCERNLFFCTSSSVRHARHSIFYGITHAVANCTTLFLVFTFFENSFIQLALVLSLANNKERCERTRAARHSKLLKWLY